MGLSSNQARFLSLTSRQVDLEHRIQQICQRRLRLASELENVATQYNNSISNRKMFTKSLSGLEKLTVSNIEALGYKVLGLDVNTNRVKDRSAIVPVPGQIVIDSQDEFLDIVSQMNSGIGLNGNYILNCDIDLNGYDTAGRALINDNFTGNFDGNGHIIDNLHIDSGATAVSYLGMFATIDAGAKVSNVALTNFSINASNGNYAGGIAGISANGSTVDNCYVSGSISAGGGIAGGILGVNRGVLTNSTADVDVSGNAGLGGVTGQNFGGVISNTVALGNVTGVTPWDIGGFAGSNYNGGYIENCSASGNVIGDTCVGGFTGTNGTTSTITNCYATGDVSGDWSVGGFVGNNFGTSINHCYAAGGVISSTGALAGFSTSGGAIADNTNFYQNNLSTDGSSAVNANVAPLPTGTWDTSVWDLSGSLPELKNSGYTAYVDDLETGLRNGTYSVAREADEFTQDPLSLEGDEYEIVDWRSVPEINDELYKGDDVEAENKYDKTVEEINAQDKKLQLEQTSIEVEYKAISSERESVKKILDTNAQSSFKYFS